MSSKPALHKAEMMTTQCEVCGGMRDWCRNCAIQDARPLRFEFDAATARVRLLCGACQVDEMRIGEFGLAFGAEAAWRVLSGVSA